MKQIRVQQYTSHESCPWYNAGCIAHNARPPAHDCMLSGLDIVSSAVRYPDWNVSSLGNALNPCNPGRRTCISNDSGDNPLDPERAWPGSVEGDAEAGDIVRDLSPISPSASPNNGGGIWEGIGSLDE